MQYALTPGQELCQRYETLVCRVYDDGFGNKSAGWGHTSSTLPPTGTQISDNQCWQWFFNDWSCALNVVDSSVVVPLTNNQRDALTDFVFNVGPGIPGKKDGFVWLKTGSHSTMLKLLNAGNYDAAQREFSRWINVDGVPNEDLRRRRKAEAELFATPDPDS